MIAGALKDSVHPALLASGEPIELARRFCAANHRYGSTILIDTRTFDSVSETIVARPIDFLSGTNSQDRHRNLRAALAYRRSQTGAYRPTRFFLERRRSVSRKTMGGSLFRISESTRSRGTKTMLPLQFYLRRLEPLVLQSNRVAVGRKLSARLRRTEYPVALRNLIAQLRQMPGVGPRSAERIALWMVRARDDKPEQIARAITDTRQSIRPCKLCGFFAAGEICDICADSSRSTELLCVVEQPTDILPLEKTSAFRGRYHSLGGKISPLDHVGPEDLRIKELLERVDQEKIIRNHFRAACRCRRRIDHKLHCRSLEGQGGQPYAYCPRHSGRRRPRIGG